MINKDNFERVVTFNQTYISNIKSKIELLKSSGDPLISSKPLEYIKTYLFENAHVLEFPIKNSDYGGLVFYHNKNFYIQINSAQPKIYENFMWAHEFYHFYFDKEKVKKQDENFVLVDRIFDEKERLPNLFAGEFLINDFILERKFNAFKKENPTGLIDIVINLIPVFEVPYKAIVIKLAQNQLIDIHEAKAIIDYDYKNNLPDDIDRTLFSASYKIKIDHYNTLLSEASKNLNDDDYQSIVEKYNALYKLVLDWREELGGGIKNEG
ncbi:ImmA/IrrE family metallo-endopeptidase [Lentibacillus salinarum]|uniref:ImmA/IrrE family metallo-endopeptidase n=1 Tax=Lentibacillus salinarum TaxID=446820 RepID=A0ABW3ZUI4_9BACI